MTNSTSDQHNTAEAVATRPLIAAVFALDAQDRGADFAEAL